MGDKKVMRQDEKVETIRSCFLFEGAEDKTVERVAAASRIIRHRARETLFFSGDPADGLRIVCSGLVRIWIANESGKELTLTLLEPGDPFGEIALLDGLPRTACATALDDGTCLFLAKSVVDEALAQEPGFAHYLITLLCELLRRNTDIMGGFAFLDLDARLARKLFDLATVHGEQVGNTFRLTRKFSQTDLGQMLGVTREAINKRLMALVHDELVKFEDGHLIVTDIAGLRERSAEPSE